MTSGERGELIGPRTVVCLGDAAYPSALADAPDPPKKLYAIGDMRALSMPSLAVVGARKATPYGKGCAGRFSAAAAKRGIVIVSGGARGCDSEAHRAALDAHGLTVAFLGGGCDRVYPKENRALFQRIIDEGGAVVSEHPWDFPPVPYAFRLRNRLIAGVSQATLIVEAGLPSGTFSTADEALAAGREVLAVPGAITAASSRGANRLIAQGAVPVVDDESLSDALDALFGPVESEAPSADQATLPLGCEGGAVAGCARRPCEKVPGARELFAAISAEPLGMEALRDVARGLCGDAEAWTWLVMRLAEGERDGLIMRYPDGRYGPVVRAR